MKNDGTLTIRISAEEKNRLQLEAEAKGLSVSDLVREMVAERTGRELLGKDIMTAHKTGVELTKEPCPFCGVEVDWRVVKIYEPFLFGESGKRCPSCEELVFAYSEKKGWEKRNPGKEKVSGGLFGNIITYDSEEESEKE